MTELKIASRSCLDPSGARRSFHYFLTIDLEESPHFCMEHYGVRVTEETGSTSLLPAITTSPTRIDELLTLLVDNTVGPTGLADVVSDWK